MKILLRLPNWLGDLVMSTAFVTAVQQQYPGSEIHAIVKKELLGVARLIPSIHTIHSFSKQEFKGLRGVYRFGRQLKIEEFDLFFSLTDSISSAIMGLATSSKKRIGFRKEGRAIFMTKTYNKPKGLHRVDEYISLLELFTGCIVKHRKVEIRPISSVQENRELILINFNSEAASRRMPLMKGRKLLSDLIAAFPNAQLGLIGATKEKGFVDDLMQGLLHAKNLVNFSGKTNLDELVELMASAQVILTTDSGPAHLANSLATPTIVLFGAGNEWNTAPYNKQNLHIIRAGQLPCEPCVKNTCILYGVPKCLELLDGQQIIQCINLYRRHA